MKEADGWFLEWPMPVHIRLWVVILPYMRLAILKTKYMSVSIFVSEQRNYTMKNSVVCLLSTSLHVQLARHSDSKGFH